MGHTPPRPEIISEVIAGGIFEVLRRHTVEQRLDELPGALPPISHMCIASFFGLEHAARVSSLPPAPIPGRAAPARLRPPRAPGSPPA